VCVCNPVAGQDLAVVISNTSVDYPTAVMIDCNLRCQEIRGPLLNTHIVTDTAMAAAGGKLYLIGGHTMQEQQYPTFIEVYDPHVSADTVEACSKVELLELLLHTAREAKLSCLWQLKLA
jgi:hypothetical protein